MSPFHHIILPDFHLDWTLWASQLPSESWKFRMSSDSGFFKSWLPEEWLVILHGFAILTSLSKWSIMEILPDRADLVQATHFQVVLHPFMRMIGFKNWSYIWLKHDQIHLNQVPCICTWTIWLPGFPPILEWEGTFNCLHHNHICKKQLGQLYSSQVCVC